VLVSLREHHDFVVFFILWMTVNRFMRLGQEVFLAALTLVSIAPPKVCSHSRKAGRNPQAGVSVESEPFHTSPKRLGKLHCLLSIDIR